MRPYNSIIIIFILFVCFSSQTDIISAKVEAYFISIIGCAIGVCVMCCAYLQHHNMMGGTFVGLQKIQLSLVIPWGEKKNTRKIVPLSDVGIVTLGC